MPHNVRTHSRRTADGRTTTVHQHNRKGGSGRKYGPTPGHAGKLGLRALAHVKRGRKGKALMFGLLCLGELGLYLTLNGTAMVLAVVGSLLVGLSYIITR